jgi:hypothetical protein
MSVMKVLDPIPRPLPGRMLFDHSEHLNRASVAAVGDLVGARAPSI